MAVIRRQCIDPAMLVPSLHTAVSSTFAGPSYLGNMVDKRGVWRRGRDGIYPTFSDASAESLIARCNTGAGATTRNMLVCASLVMGSATTPQVGVAMRATSTSAACSADTLIINAPTNQVFLGRFLTGSYQQLSRATASLTPSASTEYACWIMGYSAAVGDTFNTYGWVTTEAAWETDLTSRMTVSEDQAAFKVNTATWGAMALAAHTGTKITKIRAWEWDGTYSAVAWADSDPSGPKLKCTQVGGVSGFTYQWYRSTAANSGFSTLAAGTTATHTDTTATEGTIYFYKCVVTDVGNSNATATSEVIYARKLPATLKIGFIGTSWMALDSNHFASASQTYTIGTIPQLVGEKLAARSGRLVTVTNQGVSGSTSAQWVSGQSNMTTALSAFSSAGTTHVYVDAMGLNDITGGVSSPTHKSNLQNICATLVAAGYTVLLGYSGLYFPSNASGRGVPELDTTLAYNAANDEVVNGTSIRAAGRQVMKIVADYPGGMDDLLHPSLGFSSRVADAIAGDFYSAMTGESGLVIQVGGRIRAPLFL